MPRSRLRYFGPPHHVSLSAVRAKPPTPYEATSARFSTSRAFESTSGKLWIRPMRDLRMSAFVNRVAH